MQFNQINYFLRTCDTLNFTHAAEICNVSQPSLSTAIQKLEDELGGDLFWRKGRNLTLTPLGDAMRVQLSQVEEAKNSAKSIASEIVRGVDDVINIGLMCTLSPDRVLVAIASFIEERPDVEVLVHDIRESRVQELLLSGAFECAVMAHTERLPDRFEECSLFDEHMLLAINESHPLNRNETIQLSDLHDHYYIDRLRCEYRESFFNELATRNLRVKTVIRSEREDLIKESISQGIGMTIMPKNAAITSGLHTREITDLSVVRKISLVTVRERELKSSTQLLIQEIQAAYNNR